MRGPSDTACVTRMHTLAVVNMKGGVAKTTTAIHLAAGLAANGSRVLLVDTDPQGTVANTFRVPPTRTLSDVLMGGDAASAVIPGVRENLDIIAATPAAFALETRLAGAMQRETLLARALRPLGERYAFIVLDTSPAMSLLTYNALLCATGVVMPVGMEPMAIIGARQTLDGIEQIQSLWPDHPIALVAVVPTAVNSSTHASRATMEALESDGRLGAALFRAGIRQCLDLTYATAQGQTIWEYAPRSRAAEDYTALVNHVRAVLTGKDAAVDGEVAEVETENARPHAS